MPLTDWTVPIIKPVIWLASDLSFFDNISGLGWHRFQELASGPRPVFHGETEAQLLAPARVSRSLTSPCSSQAAAGTVAVLKRGLLIFSFYFGNKHLAVSISGVFRWCSQFELPNECGSWKLRGRIHYSLTGSQVWWCSILFPELFLARTLQTLWLFISSSSRQHLGLSTFTKWCFPSPPSGSPWIPSNPPSPSCPCRTVARWWITALGRDRWSHFWTVVNNTLASGRSQKTKYPYLSVNSRDYLKSSREEAMAPGLHWEPPVMA